MCPQYVVKMLKIAIIENLLKSRIQDQVLNQKTNKKVKHTVKMRKIYMMISRNNRKIVHQRVRNNAQMIYNNR
jgi:hypothetical protein